MNINKPDSQLVEKQKERDAGTEQILPAIIYNSINSTSSQHFFFFLFFYIAKHRVSWDSFNEQKCLVLTPLTCFELLRNIRNGSFLFFFFFPVKNDDINRFNGKSFQFFLFFGFRSKRKNSFLLFENKEPCNYHE